MVSSFILGQSALADGTKSAKSLASHIGKENGPTHHEAVYLIINTKIYLTKIKDYTPRIIPLSKGLDKLENKSVLLVTKDPSLPYRDALTKKDSPTEDVFNQIYTLTKLKHISKDPKKLTKLFKEFDIIVADNRVHKFLPDILGARFYVKNKKIPFMVQMAKPDKDARLSKGKKSTKLKDDRCEPEYVRYQMKSIVRNASYVPSATGTCISVKIGYSDWKPEELLTNANDVIKYLVEPKFLPVGGLLRTPKNLVSVHIKTSESISLPIFKQKEDIKEEDDDDSDLDF
jgi:ribosome biogenesis protein UTP30